MIHTDSLKEHNPRPNSIQNLVEYTNCTLSIFDRVTVQISSATRELIIDRVRLRLGLVPSHFEEIHPRINVHSTISAPVNQR